MYSYIVFDESEERLKNPTKNNNNVMEDSAAIQLSAIKIQLQQLCQSHQNDCSSKPKHWIFGAGKTTPSQPLNELLSPHFHFGQTHFQLYIYTWPVSGGRVSSIRCWPFRGCRVVWHDKYKMRFCYWSRNTQTHDSLKHIPLFALPICKSNLHLELKHSRAECPSAQRADKTHTAAAHTFVAMEEF